MGTDEDVRRSEARAGSARGWIKGLIALALAALLLIALGRFGSPQHWLQVLARQEAVLRAARAAHPGLVILGAFLVYVAVTGLSLPGAALLSLCYGWFFGFWTALVLVSFASTSGATLAFLLSRFLLRDFVRQRFGDRVNDVLQAFQRDGASYLFLMRLIVGIPFFVINLLMGLTSISVRTFWWVSQLGMLPGTVVYVFTGASLPGIDAVLTQGVKSLFSWKLVLAFAALGLFPLVMRKIVSAWWRSRVDGSPQSAGKSSSAPRGES